MSETVYKEWKCPGCGDEVTEPTPESWQCVVCGEEMEPQSEFDYTPNDELRELVDEWTENAEIDAATDNYDAADRWEQAANQLESLVDD